MCVEYFRLNKTTFKNTKKKDEISFNIKGTFILSYSFVSGKENINALLPA